MVAVCAAALLAACGNDATGADEGAWREVWRDDFDGPAGALPDSTRWTFDVGTDWGNRQLEFDTRRPENVSLDGNGFLHITARREAYRGAAYTSGRIKTQGLFARTGGRFEARIHLPTGQGIWPAFWLLGANIDVVGWPACGEIDVMEFRGQEPNVAIGSVHGPGYSGGGALSRRFGLPGGGRFDAGFHVFAVEWRTDRITWMLDGSPLFSVTPANLPSGARWVFDHDFFIILNVAVGGNFVGPPDSTTVFPQTMRVDWVRVLALQP